MEWGLRPNNSTTEKEKIMTRKESIEAWSAAIVGAILSILFGLYVIGLIPPIGGMF